MYRWCHGFTEITDFTMILALYTDAIINLNWNYHECIPLSRLFRKLKPNLKWFQIKCNRGYIFLLGWYHEFKLNLSWIDLSIQPNLILHELSLFKPNLSWKSPAIIKNFAEINHDFLVSWDLKIHEFNLKLSWIFK